MYAPMHSVSGMHTNTEYYGVSMYGVLLVVILCMATEVVNIAYGQWTVL